MYMAPLWSQRPIPRGHEIYSLVEGFLVNIIQFFLSDVQKKRSLKMFEKCQILAISVLPQRPLWSKSHVIYNSCSSYPEDATYYIWKELAEKLKIINSQRMPTDGYQLQ